MATSEVPRLALRVDGKGRVSIGALRIVATDLYIGQVDDDGTIVLTPVDLEVGSSDDDGPPDG